MEKGAKIIREDFESLKLQNQFSMILSNVVIPAVIWEASAGNLDESSKIVRNTFNMAETILVKSLGKNRLPEISKIKEGAISAALETLGKLNEGE